MIIMGIDSGIEKTGYAIFRKDKKLKNGFEYLSSGLIKTSKNLSTEKRLLEIHDSIKHLIKSQKPEALAIEQLFFFKNQKTVIRVAQAQGVIMLLATQHKLKVDFLTPLQIKLAITGYGQADKKSVQKMLGLTLKLNGELKQDDQADAIACGLAYCYLNKGLETSS